MTFLVEALLAATGMLLLTAAAAIPHMQTTKVDVNNVGIRNQQ